VIGPLLEHLGTRAHPTDSSAPAVQWEQIGDAQVALCRLRREEGGPLGWVAAIGNGCSGGVAPGFATEALEAVAGCLEEQLRLAEVLDGTTAELGARYEELNLVYGMVGHIRRYEHLDQFFDHLLQTCSDHLDVILTAIVHTDDGLAPVHCTNPGSDLDPDLTLRQIRAPLCHFVTAGGETVVINGNGDSRRQHLISNLPGHNLLAAPILAGGRVMALLLALRGRDRGDFTNSDRSLLELAADQASIVTRAHQMFTEMRMFTGQMATALISTVEAKDPYTRGHSERVSKISRRIGEAMGFRNQDLEQLYWGALLHDIGKIGVPDQILRKPGALDRDEYTFVKVHPEQSYEILRHIGYLGEGIQAARHHQERFDGTGYPLGLAGRSIPLFARIIAVADTFDAITSSRSYRPRATVEDALLEIQRVAGSQLDPEIAQVFLGLCAAESEWVQTITQKREHAHG
jgi:hypothetical protein